ncbi:MAG: bifunctional metallophosphatase/5'-nucleotidase [Oscillospiraceae bacterium]|nr:bifunctional metallophosphatase/5'-nucleotidase [Oscillospiraceae bacterium]
MKKFLSLALAFVMTLSLAAPALAAEKEDEAITILYTNDVHSYVSKDLTYSRIAAYKASLDNVLLVDAGDNVQGTVYGADDKGESIVKLMNAAGYDAATLGNHEFDYTMAGTQNVIEWAKYPYLSCNLYHEGELMLEPYKVFEVGGKKVALVGITTPESITKSTPKYFMDDEGNFVYSIAGGEDGTALYTAVQTAIDAAAKEADVVIALGHLGIDEASEPWTSRNVIANTTGLSAFIDGHSHSEIPMEEVTDKAGRTVILSQTGTGLENVGRMSIAADGTVKTELLTAEDLADFTPDAEVKALEEALVAAVDAKLDQIIGATKVNLNINGTDGKRSVRKEETNIGNFCQDAYLYVAGQMGFEVDVAFNTGGGIRATIPAGEITTKMVKTVYPWDGEVVVKDITGQELLDALEWGCRTANVENTNEVGGFPNVANIKFDVNLAVESTVQQDETGMWAGAPTGEYRVRNVRVKNRTTGEYEPLDLNKTYTAVSGVYILDQMGDGYAMFKGTKPSAFLAADYVTLVEYIKSFPVDKETGLPTIGEGMGYDEFVHTGRINYFNHPADLDENEWWYEVAVWALDNKVMKGTDKGFEAETFLTEASVLQTLYNLEGQPEAAKETAEWFTNAVNWATENGIVADFEEDSVINRGQVKELLEKYCELKDVNADSLMQGNENGDMMLDKELTRAEFAQILVNLSAIPMAQ